VTATEREQLLDEIARTFARAAVEKFLAAKEPRGRAEERPAPTVQEAAWQYPKEEAPPRISLDDMIARVLAIPPRRRE
jgi:hypothetical protein